MKIRIKGNSIRYRLTQSEVKTLAETGHLAEETCFGPEQKFGYALKAKAGISGLQANFDGGTITMFIHADAAQNWPASDQVGFENEVEISPGVFLKLLLEKDFACLDETSEDQADNFPNPEAICTS